MHNSNKFKVKNTKFQMVLEVIAVIILLGMYAFLILRWNELPDRVPGHYNASGVINRWGNKSELIILPIVSTVMYLLLTVIELFPSAWNIPVTATENNVDKIYGGVKSMMLFLKVEMLINFFYLNYNSIQAKSLPSNYLPIVLVILFCTITFFITRTVRLSHTSS